MNHLAFHLHLHAEAQVTDCGNARFVDITQWQMQQQALHIVNTKPLQAGQHRLADTLQFGQPGQGALTFDMHNRIGFHQRVFGQRSYADCGARRIRLNEIFRHDAVHPRKMREIGKENIEFDYIGQ